MSRVLSKTLWTGMVGIRMLNPPAGSILAVEVIATSLPRRTLKIHLLRLKSHILEVAIGPERLFIIIQ